jgi:hypothetical protein
VDNSHAELRCEYVQKKTDDVHGLY